jgi:hypothetical protein
MKHAEAFIKEKIGILAINNGDNFETIVVRLEPKYAAMLKVMAKQFKFSLSTSLTEIISKHLFDMVVSLNDNDFKEFKEKIKYYIDDESIMRSKLDRHAMGILTEKNIIPKKYYTFDLPDFPDI